MLLERCPEERARVESGSLRRTSAKLRHVLEQAKRLRVAKLLPFVIFFGIALAHAAAYAWTCDDAFISFRYAENLFRGRGLVYNLGERVEGYTNFLWVVELSFLRWIVGASFAKLSVLLSAAFTVGTFAVTLALAFRGPLVAYRHLCAVLAVGALAINRNFAVWSTSGLESRQFTFFVLLAVWLVVGASHRPKRLLAASLALAGAALTRPEGPLVFAGFGLWYLIERRQAGRISWRALATLVLPFVLLVGGHFVFRRLYYGEWLPNTYYAKHVRAWPDMGITYFGAVAIESGLYLTVPLAVLGALYRWIFRGSSLHVLSACLILPHVVYVVHIGGDHFEFRPLDFYWPLLALATAEGMALVTFFVRVAARRQRWLAPRQLSTWAGYVVALVVAYHSVALQLGQYALFYDAPFEGRHVNASLSQSSFPFAHLSPLTSRFVPVYDAAMSQLLAHAIAVRHREHERFAVQQRRRFAAYGEPGRRQLPPGVVIAYPYAGIGPYHLPEATFIDTLGLTDRTIARNHQPKNADRVMAHDRRPPPGYLQRRGVNLELFPAAPTKRKALEAAHFAVELKKGLWMPFESSRPAWARQAFASFPLYERPPKQPHPKAAKAEATKLEEAKPAIAKLDAAKAELASKTAEAEAE